MPNKEETKKKKDAINKARNRLAMAHPEELEEYIKEEFKKEGLKR